MVNDDEINVEYDTTGVPSTPTRNSENYYLVKISQYFYTKLNSVVNDNDFNNNEINTYNLTVNNGNIDISTTKKLINYFKSLIKKNVEVLDSKIDTKLNSADYIIDNDFKVNSSNPLANNVISEKMNNIDNNLNNKANVVHSHNINEINSLNTYLNSLSNDSATNTDLNNHISNRNNPHNVTAQQLGVPNMIEEVRSAIPSPNSVASNSKGLGTQSAGVSNDYARADHVHPKPTLTLRQTLTKNGATVKVYEDGLNVYVTFSGTTTNMSARGEIRVGTISTTTYHPAIDQYGVIASAGSDIKCYGYVSDKGLIIVAHTDDVVAKRILHGYVIYPLKSRLP